jgi:uncharacterized membrane protein
MMSQNRQETRDRLRAENDYKINLKAEVEIRNLHEKLDHLLLKKMGQSYRDTANTVGIDARKHGQQ